MDKKIIFNDNEREIVLSGDEITISKNGQLLRTYSRAGLSVRDELLPGIPEGIRKQGGNPSKYFMVFSTGASPAALPISAKPALDKVIRDREREYEEYRNKPENREMNHIEALRSKADRIERGTESSDSWSDIFKLRMEADRLEKIWRSKYQNEATKEDARKLVARAEHEESLAVGALTYDADGWIGPQEQQKRHDDFMVKAAKYRKQAADLLNTSKTQSSVVPGVTAGGSETSKDKPVEPEPYVSSKPSKPRIKVTMPEIRKIQSGRSEKSQIADSAFTSKNLILPKQRNRLFRWKNHPERWDVQNIDTKGSRRKSHPYKGIIKHKR
jgi:hypothetical protein